jgi:protein TonB
MERPSHIIFDTRSRYFSHRLPLIGLALSFQAAAVWLFMHAFVPQGFRLPPDVLKVDWLPEKPATEIPPPPPPRMPEKLDLPRVPPPQFGTDVETARNTITATSSAPAQQPSVSAQPDRALLSITATHTAPPYPPIARRMGVEGKVTLRLTVTPEGRVAQAAIVTSSGRDDLDQSAQAWIVAHWRYKPALANGAPVPGHTLATVVFSLINEH